jgi:hypothetical protein
MHGDVTDTRRKGNRSPLIFSALRQSRLSEWKRGGFSSLMDYLSGAFPQVACTLQLNFDKVLVRSRQSL